ncbi:hypothetical protein AX17_002159 [Amanita inopinata Kibby_2008]|nr:hypothetical protein AX17_002159 [Amanita inopinata Kibby_2008]
MNPLQSTQLISANNLTGDGKPEQLQDYLRTLMTQHFSGDPLIAIRDAKRDWDTLITGLSDNFLTSFPLPGSVPWSAMNEKTAFLEAILEIIFQASQRVEGIFTDKYDAVKNIFIRLLKFCNILDVWVEAGVEIEHGLPSPRTLREKCFQALVGVLRCLGGKIARSGLSKEPRWRYLRSILIECEELIHDMLSDSTSFAVPVSISLFKKPRLQEEEALFGTTSELMVVTQSQFAALLTLLLDVLAQVLYPALFAQWYLSDIIRRLHKTFDSAFNLLLFSERSVSLSTRARSLSGLVFSAVSICRHSADIGNQFADLPFRLLKYCMLQNASNCSVISPVVLKAIEIHSKIPPLEARVKEVAQLLKLETSEDLSALMIAYLRSVLPQASKSLLCIAKEMFSNDRLMTFHDTLLSEVDQYYSKHLRSNERQELESVLPNRAQSSSQWRQRVRAATESLINMERYSWMDIDDVTDYQFASFNLCRIQDYFENRSFEASPTAMDVLVDRLSNLCCVLSRCDNLHCSGCSKFIEIAALLRIIELLLQGPQDRVTTTVRQRIYNTLSHAIKHHAEDTNTEQWTRTCSLIMDGVVDKDRSMRLAAGRSLRALLGICCASDNEASRVVSQAFDRLYHLLEVAKMSVKETLIITLGSCGETENQELLEQVLCLLIAQFGRPNPVVRGVACVKFFSIVKKHNKTGYSIVLPFLDRIAPFLISRMCSQPILFHEACRAMATQPNVFIMSNLARALPQLFADCDTGVLEKIANQLETTLSTLFLKHSHKILAHIFLQRGQSKKALKFIVKILVADSQDAQRASIDTASVIQSCLVPLLSELVVQLGDENPENTELAKHALRDVERLLAPKPMKGRALPIPDLGAFLKNYMLGIISGLSDMLQGVHGKKSVAVKRKIVRSIGILTTFIGPPISNVASQIMAIFQTMINIAELAEPTLESWHQFLSVLGAGELGPHVGPTSAAFVASWPSLSSHARKLADESLANIVLGLGEELGQQLDEIVDLSEIEDLKHIQLHIEQLRSSWTPRQKLQRILDRSLSDNLSVSIRSLTELKAFMFSEQRDFVNELASGDIFDPIISRVLEVLFSAAARDGEGTQPLRLLVYECIGVLGAVDPDRCEFTFKDPTMIVSSNFADEGESILLALHLIKDLLVGAFRSTSDISYQTRLAYAIQELLKFCQFTPALVTAGNTGGSVSLRIRNRWNNLPKHVLETVSPLLEARYALHQTINPETQLPVYPHHSTYRDWIQTWTAHLITKVSGQTAQTIFNAFRSIVRYKDVVIARHILPHLVLNVLVSGNDDDSQAIRSEFLAVLEDQINPQSDSLPDKKLLSAQAVFMLLDHLSKWVRIIRKDVNAKKSETKRSRANQVYSQAEEQLLRVDSILSSIDQHLMAKAAYQCKAYARSLMNFESQILTIQERSPSDKNLSNYYETIHKIYAHLDEPDGMEGVSTLILSPSLEHQIRQHESTGRWTSAQSCWELKLQQSPDNVEYHLGLLRCLRNLGHYDSLRTHVRGVLTRNPEWETALIRYQLESAWMVGAWEDVKTMVELESNQIEPAVMARVLLSMRSGDFSAIKESLRTARLVLGAPIAAAGATGYRRVYDAVLNLHLMHELEAIHDTIVAFPTDSQPGSQRQKRQILSSLSSSLALRLDATLPTFRTREPVLSMRRTAFGLTPIPRQMLAQEVGRSWIASAKIARKAGQWQTAYSAVLQAQQSGPHLSFLESAKLVKVRGEDQRALRELENSMRLFGFIQDSPDMLDLTLDNIESKTIKAKAQVLRARWMHESERYETPYIFKIFSEAAETLPAWENGHFRLGQFHDECFKGLTPNDKVHRGLKMNMCTVRSYAKAIRAGSKFVYQTIPRILTIWLDLGEDKRTAGTDVFRKINDVVARVTRDSPAYKWYTAFPQIVSRVGTHNPEVYKHLSALISRVIKEYPKQALWLFTSVIKSTKSNREQRGRVILDQLRNNPSDVTTYLSRLIDQSVAMTNELLALCDRPVDEDKRQLSMSKDFPRLAALGRSQLIIPLQESLTASLPPTSTLESTHQPFPSGTPTFQEFSDEIDVMRSLAKPRKITIKGSDGQIYTFLGKPKDDLRKDARLMDFNAIINKLLKANSESRRRQLHIRTYGVVTLNEECGFIQWVPNTIPIRPVLLKYYDARRIRSWTSEMNDIFKKIKDMTDREAGESYSKKILPMFPPVFHEWFIETFPEPTVWLTSRLTYSRTAAVMSMVGFILGLGDRHCENILLDTNTGDVVHVDFNCLFEKGKTLETPERVPFRLSQNLVDGLGVTGVEGVFRIACEVTLQLLRDNKDSLMSVLDAFIHDPLVEWEDEKRKLEREPTRRNQVKASVDLRMLARNALNPIEKKLNGVYTMSKERMEKELSTNALVQVLIQEATDTSNLAKMYPGWASWH